MLIALLALDVIALLIVIVYAVLAETSHHWPEAEGVILRSSLITHWDAGSNSYSARVDYQYTVGGRTYSGARISFGYAAGLDNADDADALVYQFPVNSTVRVYYLPAFPAVSVLVPGIPQQLLPWLLGLPLLLILLVVLRARGVA